MIVTVETLAIGSLKGPRVYVVTRRVGKHLDIEEAPHDVTNEPQAVAFAAKRWGVLEGDVRIAPLQIIDVLSSEPTD